MICFHEDLGISLEKEEGRTPEKERDNFNLITEKMNEEEILKKTTTGNGLLK